MNSTPLLITSARIKILPFKSSNPSQQEKVRRFAVYGENMQIQEIKLDELHPYKGNAKKHGKKQIEILSKSLREFGWQQPLVIDRDNVIIAGHGRYEAAKLLLENGDNGFESAPCKYADELTADQIKAYRLVDNRATSVEYDLEAEFAELQEIELDMSEFDFETFSMDDIEEVEGYDKNNDDREYFEKVFTFPIEKKQQITNYLKKHIQEITEEIIRRSGEE